MYKCSNSCLWYRCWWNLDFSFKSYGKKSIYKYWMNVDDGRIMRSWRSCLFIVDINKISGKNTWDNHLSTLNFVIYYFYQLPDERISISSLGTPNCVACPCCCTALCARYKSTKRLIWWRCYLKSERSNYIFFYS